MYVGMCKQGAPNAGGTSTNNPPRLITFQFNITQGYALEFGDQYMRIISNGAYVTESAKTVSAITKANPGVVTSTSHGFSNNDWVFGSINGMTQLNGLIWIVQNVATNTFTLTDLFGNIVDTTSYSTFTSGTFSRIYTVVSPYAAIDVPYLKFTQSADTMSLMCVNQQTGTEYPPYDLTRSGATNWAFTATTFATSISAPTGIAGAAQASTTLSTYYSYVVTAVAADGEESVASSSVSIHNNDISIFAGSNTVSWSPVSGATSYNIYGATPLYGAAVPVGVLYGFVGTSISTNFVDTNIVPDFTTVPPVHTNPFARGQITGVTVTAGGSGYTQAGTTYAITTAGGSGAILIPVVSSGAVVAWIVQNSGKGYAPGDTIAVTADGSSATATLVFGAQTGTYPSVVVYYQQRRVYADTKNNPDTYYMSQPGAFTNMDSSIPVSDSDAIVGSPWAQQINGIQFMVPMPGGLVIFTGNGAWQVNGGSSAAITPADQTATPQAYGGCSQFAAPIPINYSILFVEAKQSLVYELEYNYFSQIYLRTDKTVLSNHLFANHSIQQWAYAEQPYKIVWAIREDGTMLAFTFLKEQDVYAWTRHDTNGLFQSVCSVTGPHISDIDANAYGVTGTGPLTDAINLIVKRYVNGQWVYYAERMDDRNWFDAEDTWCVDAGLSYPVSYPNATLTPAAAEGTANISSVNIAYGGTGYTNPTVIALDSTGEGSGATFSVTLSGGVITGITPLTQGTLYTPGLTTLVITDTTGSGAVASPVITNNVVFTASSSVFNSGMVGDVLRIAGLGSGGGKAVITSYQSGTQVTANIVEVITETLQNDPNNMPVPSTPGNWSIGVPTMTVSGLNHLEGKKVSILADGSVQPSQTVTNGSITLQAAYSQILIGLPFTCQIQSMYLDPPGHADTSQGKRKDIFGVTVRMEASRGMSVGSNQPDASTQPNGLVIPWTGLYPFKERNATTQAGNPIPLFTGDEYILIGADWLTNGQIAIETQNPLPCNVNAIVAWYQLADTSG